LSLRAIKLIDCRFFLLVCVFTLIFSLCCTYKEKCMNDLLRCTCGVVVTTLAFQAGKPRFNPWSDLFSRSYKKKIRTLR
jgi:hypothetical protein